MTMSAAQMYIVHIDTIVYMHNKVNMCVAVV